MERKFLVRKDNQNLIRSLRRKNQQLWFLWNWKRVALLREILLQLLKINVELLNNNEMII